MSQKVTEMRRKIIDTAKKIIAESGVKNASLQAIADEVGISKGSMYHYFKTKNAILYKIIDEEFRQSNETVKKFRDGILDKENLNEEIFTGMEERLEKTTENKLHLYLAYEAMIGNKEIRDSYQEKYQEWHRDITEGFTYAFDLSDKDAKIMAFLFICMMDGWCMQDILGTENIDREEALNFLKRLELKY